MFVRRPQFCVCRADPGSGHSVPCLSDSILCLPDGSHLLPAPSVFASLIRPLTSTFHNCRTVPGSDLTVPCLSDGPRFREEPKDASAESGEKVTVKCDVDANPSPEIVWFKRDCDGCQKVNHNLKQAVYGPCF